MKKLVVSLSTAMALVATAQAQNVPVRVTADAPVTAPYPVSIVVTKAALKKIPKAPKGTQGIPAQFDAIGKDKVRVTFLVNNLCHLNTSDAADDLTRVGRWCGTTHQT